MPEPSSGILGRISGKLLSSNLERDGIDLTFRNQPLDPDLLYLDVNNNRLGVNLTPSFDLHFIDGKSIDGIVDNQLSIGNNDLLLNTSQIVSLTNSITVSPLQTDPIITMPSNRTSQLEINDNYILNYVTNGSINLDPNNLGQVKLENNTVVDGDLTVTGNITVSGNLSKQGNLIIGDDIIDSEENIPENDTVDFYAPISQHLLPGIDGGFDLGGSRGDSTSGRWAELFITDNLINTTNILSFGATVSDQVFLDGINAQITTIQSNEDILLSPDSGTTRIENIILRQNSIVNTYSDSTPIIFSNTGTGYYNFLGNNGMVIPLGGTSERADYEVGTTRWNNDLQQIECFDGTVWIVSIGPGSVDQEEMEELSFLYSLTLA